MVFKINLHWTRVEKVLPSWGNPKKCMKHFNYGSDLTCQALDASSQTLPGVIRLHSVRVCLHSNCWAEKHRALYNEVYNAAM